MYIRGLEESQKHFDKALELEFSVIPFDVLHSLQSFSAIVLSGSIVADEKTNKLNVIQGT